jgi:hypothetical protein
LATQASVCSIGIQDRGIEENRPEEANHRST